MVRDKLYYPLICQELDEELEEETPEEEIPESEEEKEGWDEEIE